jgi:hypothetical protein
MQVPPQHRKFILVIFILEIFMPVIFTPAIRNSRRFATKMPANPDHPKLLQGDVDSLAV